MQDFKRGKEHVTTCRDLDEILSHFEMSRSSNKGSFKATSLNPSSVNLVQFTNRRRLIPLELSNSFGSIYVSHQTTKKFDPDMYSLLRLCVLGFAWINYMMFQVNTLLKINNTQLKINSK